MHYLVMELMPGEALAQRVKRDSASAIPPVKSALTDSGIPSLRSA